MAASDVRVWRLLPHTEDAPVGALIDPCAGGTMRARPVGAVARVAAWQHGGISYHVLIGRVAGLAGYLTVMAFGPDAAYRAVVVGPAGAHRTLAGLMASRDPATRSGTAECLLALRATFVH